MGKQYPDEDQKKRSVTEKQSMHGVIITTYVESQTVRSNKKVNPKKKIKGNPFSEKLQTARTQGYDRRAKLLAYAQGLRAVGTREVPRPKPKRKWSSRAPRIPISFFGIFRRTKRGRGYERVVSEQRPEVELYCAECNDSRKKKKTKKKKKTTERSSSYFCGKLKRMLKALSWGWRCTKPKG